MRTICLLLLLAGIASAGYLGARLADDEKGVRLESIVPDSPAAKAGLAAGDVVVGFKTAAELGAKLRESEAGSKLELEVLRDGEKRTVVVTLGVHPRVLLELPDTSPGMLGGWSRGLSVFMIKAPRWRRPVPGRAATRARPAGR